MTPALLLSFALSMTSAQIRSDGPAPLPAITHTPAYWHLALLQGRVSERVLVWVEAQPRLSLDENPRLDRLLLRSALGVAVTDDLSLWAGVAWIPAWNSWSPIDMSANELRVYQQLLYNVRLGALALQSRTRLEQRLSAEAPPASPDEIGHRARTLLRAALSVVDDRTLSLVMWDEVFMNYSFAPHQDVLAFDQNRLFVGLSWRALPTVTLEIGVLNATQRMPDESLAMTHGLYTFSVFTLP
jgi:hypothetical protein